MAKRARDDIILACKEGGCPWDYRAAPIFEVKDKYGQRLWLRKVRCRDCGSVKFQRYEPRLPLVKRGSWRYERPPGWYEADLKHYWQHATDERVARGQVAVPPSADLRAVRTEAS